jgi:hypothetical protein
MKGGILAGSSCLRGARSGLSELSVRSVKPTRFPAVIPRNDGSRTLHSQYQSLVNTHLSLEVIIPSRLRAESTSTRLQSAT